jgi:cytochrome c peroxidase
MKRVIAMTIFALTWAAIGIGEVPSTPARDADLATTARQYFQPLPATMATAEFPATPARVALGRELFFDSRLSLDGTVSCATCHHPSLYGTDALPKAIGAQHRANARNAPTVLNAALQFRAHWLGDRANVEEQAKKSLTGAASFGNPDAAAVVRKIKSIPGYAAAFAAAFPGESEPVTPENWGKAIGAYERTLTTPSPFDAYLKGDAAALSGAAQSGLREFIKLGCVACHGGVGVGGDRFAKFGVVADYWLETRSDPIDEGRFAVTQDAADKYVFKVPSLRNVAMTPPYFHDGSVAALPDAARVMAKAQLGKPLTAAQSGDLIAFLNGLTGELPASFATEPILAPQAFSAVPLH